MKRRFSTTITFLLAFLFAVPGWLQAAPQPRKAPLQPFTPQQFQAALEAKLKKDPKIQKMRAKQSALRVRLQQLKHHQVVLKSLAKRAPSLQSLTQAKALFVAIQSWAKQAKYPRAQLAKVPKVLGRIAVLERKVQQAQLELQRKKAALQSLENRRRSLGHAKQSMQQNVRQLRVTETQLSRLRKDLHRRVGTLNIRLKTRTLRLDEKQKKMQQQAQLSRLTGRLSTVRLQLRARAKRLQLMQRSSQSVEDAYKKAKAELLQSQRILSGIIDAIKKGGSSLLNKAAKVASSALNGAKAWTAETVRKLGNDVEKLGNDVKKAIGKLAGALRRAVISLTTQAHRFAKQVWKSQTKTVLRMARHILTGFAKQIRNMIQTRTLQGFRMYATKGKDSVRWKSQYKQWSLNAKKLSKLKKSLMLLTTLLQLGAIPAWVAYKCRNTEGVQRRQCWSKHLPPTLQHVSFDIALGLLMAVIDAKIIAPVSGVIAGKITGLLGVSTAGVGLLAGPIIWWATNTAISMGIWYLLEKEVRPLYNKAVWKGANLAVSINNYVAKVVGLVPIPRKRSCPRGTYRNVGNTQCIPCPAGTYAKKAYAAHPSVCKPCPIGKVSPAGSAYPSACRWCSSGTSAVSGPKRSRYCKRCPLGQTSAKGLPCWKITCSSTEYRAVDGTNQCKSCPAGHISSSRVRGAASCKPCSAGTYFEMTWAFRSSGWGKRQRVRVAQCTSCPAGTYNPRPGGSSKSACLRCQSGYTSSQGATRCYRPSRKPKFPFPQPRRGW